MPSLVIQSHKGPYTVHFEESFGKLTEVLPAAQHLIMDAQVAKTYSKPFEKLLSSPSVLLIESTETHKSLEKIPDFMTHLLERGIRRNHTLIAVGGGIIQDITAFMASCLLRGVPWIFYPTTLLAQADSCIGSKSSLNIGSFKNQVGTFTPPKEVHITAAFLDTLRDQDLRSGIGEIIKTHILAGWEDTRNLARHYTSLFRDKGVMRSHILRALEIKKEKIEADEFDQHTRLVMNYGHTFGHALESATHYQIPHGIAVTLGMDLANFVSLRSDLLSQDDFNELHQLLTQNYRGFENLRLPMEDFYKALSRDKKNVDQDLTLILLRGPGQVFATKLPFDECFKICCRDYFASLPLQAAAS